MSMDLALSIVIPAENLDAAIAALGKLGPTIPAKKSKKSDDPVDHFQLVISKKSSTFKIWHGDVSSRRGERFAEIIISPPGNDGDEVISESSEVLPMLRDCLMKFGVLFGNAEAYGCHTPMNGDFQFSPTETTWDIESSDQVDEFVEVRLAEFAAEKKKAKKAKRK